MSEDHRIESASSARAPGLPSSDTLPQFRIGDLLLLTAGIGIQAAMVRSYPSFAPAVAISLLAVLIVMQARNIEGRFFQGITVAVWLWAGMVIPLVLIVGAANDRHFFPQSLVSAATLGVFWIGPFVIWSVCRYLTLPHIAALLSGCLAIAGLYGFLLTLPLGLSVGNEQQERLEGSAWCLVVTVIALVGVVLSGFVTGTAYLIAARAAWRGSKRNSLAILLAILGPVLLLTATQFLVPWNHQKGMSTSVSQK